MIIEICKVFVKNGALRCSIRCSVQALPPSMAALSRWAPSNPMEKIPGNVTWHLGWSHLQRGGGERKQRGSVSQTVTRLHWSAPDLFLFQIPALAQAGFRVLAVDLKGYGESSAPPGGLAGPQLFSVGHALRLSSSPAALPSPGPRSEQAVLQGSLSLYLLSPVVSSVYAVWVPSASAPHTLNEAQWSVP